MSIKQTIEKCQEIGIKCVWDRAWKEFILTDKYGGKYYTHDKKDAIGTAKEIAERQGKTFRLVNDKMIITNDSEFLVSEIPENIEQFVEWLNNQTNNII